MRWKRILRRKRWFFNIPTILWWIIWEFTKDSIIEATRDYLTGQGIIMNILDFVLQHPSIIVSIVLVGIFTWAYLDSIKEKGVETMPERGEKEQQDIHVTSYGQQGGITAGVVNIQTEAQLKISLSESTHREIDTKHIYESLLTIESRYPIPQLQVVARANSIQSLDVVPHAEGIFMFGHTGKREGYHFKTLQNAAGKYTIKITTAEPEQIQIDLE